MIIKLPQGIFSTEYCAPHRRLFLFIYIIFYLIAFFSIVTVYVSEKRFNESKKMHVASMLTWVVGFGYVLLLSLRGMTGTDTKSYLNIYQNNLYDQYHIEWVSRLVMVTCSRLGLPFESVELIFALLTVVPLIITFKKYTSNSLIAISGLYIYGYILLAFNISRQMIAVSIFVVAVLIWLNARTKKMMTAALALSAIAVSFHSSAVIMLVLFLVIHFFSMRKSSLMRKLIPWGAVLIAGMAVMVYMFAPLEKAGAVIYHLGILGDNYSYYLRPEARAHIFGRPAKLTMAISILTAGSVFIRFKYLEIKNEKYDVVLALLVLVYAVVTSLNIGWISDRLSYYFLPFLSVFLADVIVMKESKRVFKLYTLLLLFLISMLIFKRMFEYNYGGIIPYIGIFN